MTTTVPSWVPIPTADISLLQSSNLTWVYRQIVFPELNWSPRYGGGAALGYRELQTCSGYGPYVDREGMYPWR